MQTLSCLEAISPAFGRTRLVLFAPFRAGRTWKLAATAYLSRVGTIFIPFMLIYLAFLPHIRSHAGTSWAAFALGAIVVSTALYAWIFYLCSHIDFAFFDIVLHRGQFVAPAWRKYGPQSLRWSNVKVLAGLAVTALMTAPLFAYSHRIQGFLRQLPDPGQPAAALPPGMVEAMFVGYGVIFLLGGTYFLIMATLDSFVVPSLALEDVSLAEAFRRTGQLLSREPGQFLGYVVMKAVLGIAGYIVLMIAFEIALILFGLVVGVIAFLLGLLLHAVGVPPAVLTVLGVIVLIVFELVSIGYAFLMAIGTLFTFLQAYTLYFLAGRYPLLGELLAHSTPPPPGYGPPPAFPASAFSTESAPYPADLPPTI